MTREELKDLLKKAAEKGEAQYYETTPPDFADASIKHGMIVDAQLLALEAAGVRMVPVEATEAMLEAGWFEISCQHPEQSDLPRGIEEGVWEAMLAASPYAQKDTKE